MNPTFRDPTKTLPVVFTPKSPKWCILPPQSHWWLVVLTWSSRMLHAVRHRGQDV